MKNELGLRNVGVLYGKRFDSKIALTNLKDGDRMRGGSEYRNSNLFHSSHLPPYEDGTDTVFRNVGI